MENCQWIVRICGKYFFVKYRECEKTIIRFKYQPGVKGRKWIFRRVDKKKKKKKKERKTGIIGTNEADNKLIFTGLIWMSKRTVCIRNPWICSSGTTIKTCRNIKNTSVDLPWNYVCRSLNIYTFYFSRRDIFI